MANWMGIEGGDDHRSPLMGAALHRPPDHCLVAEVETVEIAERHHGAAKGLRNRLVEGQALHRFAA